MYLDSNYYYQAGQGGDTLADFEKPEMAADELLEVDPLDAEEGLADEETGGSSSPTAYNQQSSSLEVLQQNTPIYETANVQRSFNKELGKEQTRIKAKRSTLIHNIIHLNGQKFDFSGREYLRTIYDNDFKKVLLRTGRQVEKSTLNSNRILIDSIVHPYYKTLYVSPSHMQTRQFSADKLKPARDQSPIIKKYFINSQVSDQVFEKGYANGSMNYLRSAFLNADRARGISSDTNCYDEIQDLLTANIPVIAESLSHSKYGYEIFTGTPKTLDNTIEHFWDMSSQCEWLVPCKSHDPTHWNFLDEKNIGLEGPICNKCGRRINPAEGKWIALGPKRDIMGFRISQLMVPWKYQSPVKWKEVIWKMENWSKVQFYNECLGLPFDAATKPITQGEIMGCCAPNVPMIKHPSEFNSSVECFAGIDWGEGTDGSDRGMGGRIRVASYTILTLGTYVSDVFWPFYIRRFEGKEAAPEYVLAEIIRTCKAFRVIQIGADWGHGWGMNERLEAAFGKDRTIKFIHVGSLKQRRRYDPVGMKMQLNRNQVVSEIFDDIKKKKFKFCQWNEFQPFATDLLSVYAEYNEYMRSIKFDHRPDNPDDFLHSLIYSREAANIYYGMT